jgi:hypothetical protein
MLAASAVVVSAVAVAGCGSSGGDPAPSPSTSPPSASSAPSPDRTAQAEAQAVAAYEHMWAAAAAAYHAGKVTSPELEKYAIDKALADIKTTGLYYQDHGQIMNGRPTSTPHVTSIEFATTPYTADITDCLDSTHYVAVDKKTGKATDRGPGPYRHVTTAVARYNGTSWVISSVDISRDRTC